MSQTFVHVVEIFTRIRDILFVKKRCEFIGGVERLNQRHRTCFVFGLHPHPLFIDIGNLLRRSSERIESVIQFHVGHVVHHVYFTRDIIFVDAFRKKSKKRRFRVAKDTDRFRRLNIATIGKSPDGNVDLHIWVRCVM